MTITPFTAKQKRDLQQRQAARLRIRKTRTRELAAQSENSSLFPRLTGEFEKTKAIVLSISDWQSHHFDVLLELIEKTYGHAHILLLYNDKNRHDDRPQLPGLLKRLSRTGRSYSHLRFYNTNLNTIWLRDFGPRLAQDQDGGVIVMNFFYDPTRPRDDEFPKAWASLTRASHNVIPWSLQGGNLLVNGHGLAITTTRLYEENRIYRAGKSFTQDEAYVKQQVMKFSNLKQLVVLQPLEHESTRHVDMFAAFLAPDLALVAKLDPQFDAQNARILDENAQLLSEVKVGDRPIRVERIWIPPRRHDHWSTYANTILTDRLVLVPTYEFDPPQYVKAAVDTYRRLLPKHHVATIDMTSMEKLGGSLHCLSCSLPPFARLPSGTKTFAEAVKMLETGE